MKSGSKINFYKYQRGLIKILFSPLRLMSEGKLKNAVRQAILKFQHSLPTEFSVNKGDTVVQIGTPWPRTLQRFVTAVGSTGRVVLFEANPDNYQSLKQHVENKNLSNVILVNGAACNENRSGELMISPHKGDHKIAIDSVIMDNDFRTGNEKMNTTAVEFVRIDDVLASKSINKIDFLSVTVNGAELEVLQGAENTLKQSNSNARVFAKGHAIDSNTNQPLSVAIVSLLHAYGFETTLTRGEKSSSDDGVWLKRAGDVFAWKK